MDRSDRSGLLAQIAWPIGYAIACLVAWSYLEGLPLPEAGPTPLQLGFRYLLESALVFLAALISHRIFNRLVWDGLARRALGGPAPKLLKDISGTIFFFLAVTAIVGVVFDRPVTGLWATSSAVGLVLGIALKNVILDVFIGLATNIDQPYKIGDWIQIHLGRPDYQNDFFGKVLEINWRTTRIRTRDGRVVILPNSVIGSSTVTNFMEPDSRNRRKVSFHLDPWVDPDRAAKILLAGVRSAIGPEGLLEDPAPAVRAKGVGVEGARYTLEFWWDIERLSPSKAADLACRGVLKALRAAGLTVSTTRTNFGSLPGAHPQLDPIRPRDRAELLGQVSLLAALDPTELEALAKSVEVRHLGDQEVLLKQGDEGASMFVLLEGLLDVLVDFDGDVRQVHRVSPGSHLGELSLLTGEPRSATLVASGPVTLFEIQRRDLEPLFEARPDLAARLAEEVAQLQKRNQSLREASSQDQDPGPEESEVAQSLLGKMRAVFAGVLGGSSASSA